MKALRQCLNCGTFGHNSRGCPKPERAGPWRDTAVAKSRAAEKTFVAIEAEKLAATVPAERWATVLVAVFRAARLNIARTEASAFDALIEEADALGTVTVAGPSAFVSMSAARS